MRRGFYGAVVLGGFLLLGPDAAVGAQRPTRIVLPPNTPGVISVTSVDAEGLRAEKRLAQFIRALQAGHRERAARFLTSRISSVDREAFIRKRWLPANVTDRRNFYQILYWKDLHIRTMAIQPTWRRLAVVPRRIPYAPGKRTRPPTGYLEVRMLLERGAWAVDLRPARRRG